MCTIKLKVILLETQRLQSFMWWHELKAELNSLKLLWSIKIIINIQSHKTIHWEMFLFQSITKQKVSTLYLFKAFAFYCEEVGRNTGSPFPFFKLMMVECFWQYAVNNLDY